MRVSGFRGGMPTALCPEVLVNVGSEVKLAVQPAVRVYHAYLSETKTHRTQQRHFTKDDACWVVSRFFMKEGNRKKDEDENVY